MTPEYLKTFTERYAWPGGYPKFWIMKDHYGDLFLSCHDCLSGCLKDLGSEDDVKDAIQRSIVQVGINWENDLNCDICDQPIERAYEND